MATKEDRMVIAYIDKKLHQDIRIYCLKNKIPLHEWAKLAHKELSSK